MTVHLPGAGPSSGRAAPRSDLAQSTADCARMRLVNQLESGTSSIVFTFCARQPVLDRPGVPNRFYSEVVEQVDLPFLTPEASWRLGLARERIVVEELRRAAGDGRQRDERDGDAGERRPGRVVCGTLLMSPCLIRSEGGAAGEHDPASPRCPWPARSAAACRAAQWNRTPMPKSVLRRLKSRSDRSWRDLAGVVEESHVEAEAVRRSTATRPDSAGCCDRGSASSGTRAACCRCRARASGSTAPSSSPSAALREAVQREDPVLTQDRDVLDDLAHRAGRSSGVVADRRSCDSEPRSACRGARTRVRAAYRCRR